MSLGAIDTVALLQRIGMPVARAIDACADTGVLISADRPGGFFDALLRGCAAGVPDRVRVVGIDGADLAAVDGLRLHASRKALTEFVPPVARRVTSLDRTGMLHRAVIAIALGQEAALAQPWRGAAALIARDRPLFLAYGEADLSGLGAQGYAVERFDGAPACLMALPRERAGWLLSGTTA